MSLSSSGSIIVDQVNTFSFTAINQNFDISCSNISNIRFQIAGTFVGVLSFFQSVDGVTFENTAFVIDDQQFDFISDITIPLTGIAEVTGLSVFRITSQVWTSGTANITAISTQAGSTITRIAGTVGIAGAVRLETADEVPLNAGQQLMVNSLPIVIASDQTSIPITGSITATNPSVSATGLAVPVDATMIGGSDGTNLRAVKVSSSGVVSVDGSATTQPVSGTVALSAGAAVIGHVINDASSAVIGHVITDSSSVTNATLSAETTKVIGTVNVAASQTIGIAAGSAVIGHVINDASSAVIGHVIMDSGSTTVVTGNVASTIADAADVTFGAKADAKSTATDTTPISAMSVLKQISASVQAPPSQAVTNAGTFATQSTLSAETTKVIGTVNIASAQTLATVTTVGTVTGITNALPAGTNNIGIVTPNQNSGRTHVNYYATNVAAGLTTAETAISLTKSSGTAATSSAASFVITSGKKFRITSVTFAVRGNAVATIESTIFNFRINTGGAVTTSSTPIVLSARSASAATASSYDRFQLPIPDGFEITGDGTLQFGITAASTYVTNGPTWDVCITGFEY